MDYTDDVKYPETCKKACEKGIIINTIQCGNDSECQRFWKDIASSPKAPMSASSRTAASSPSPRPSTSASARSTMSWRRKTLVFGDRRKQMEDKEKTGEALKLAPAAKADRAGFAGKDGKAAAYDLLDAIKNKEVVLSKLKTEELPEELKKLDEKGRQEYLDKLDGRAQKLSTEAVDLDKKRRDFSARRSRRRVARTPSTTRCSRCCASRRRRATSTIDRLTSKRGIT